MLDFRNNDLEDPTRLENNFETKLYQQCSRIIQMRKANSKMR